MTIQQQDRLLRFDDSARPLRTHHCRTNESPTLCLVAIVEPRITARPLARGDSRRDPRDSTAVAGESPTLCLVAIRESRIGANALILSCHSECSLENVEPLLAKFPNSASCNHVMTIQLAPGFRGACLVAIRESRIARNRPLLSFWMLSQERRASPRVTT